METKEAILLSELLTAMQEEMRNKINSESSLYPEEYGGYERRDEHNAKVAGLEEMAEVVTRFLQSRVEIFAADQELMRNREAMDKARVLVMKITKYPSHVVDDMDYPNWLTVLSDNGFYWNTAVQEWAHYPR